MKLTQEQVIKSKIARLERYSRMSNDMKKSWEERKKYDRMWSRLYDELYKK